MARKYPMTEADYAAALEDERIPELHEVRAMLDRYFIAPITDTHASQLHGYLLKLRQQLPNQRTTYVTECQAFEGIHKYSGCAWREELSYGFRNPRPRDLVMFLGCRLEDLLRLPDFPRPRLYCPEPLCGTWREVEGPAIGSVWQLSPTGALRITGAGEHVDKWIKWCVSRGTPNLSHDQLRVAAEWGSWPMFTIDALDPSSLVVTRSVFRGTETRRLERVSDDADLPPVWQTV